MLTVEKSCEIGDLIDEIAALTGRSWDEVEKAFFSCGLFPDSKKTYVTDQFGGYDTGIDWLDKALDTVLSECNAKSIYITIPI
jgi:hypothetical protein